jgi:hypothetical protein
MGICCTFCGITNGVFWRFNYENNGLGWLGCKNPLNSIYFHFLFVWTCVIIALASTTYLNFSNLIQFNGEN